jgi:uncharacterized iron-regulated membrane protein
VALRKFRRFTLHRGESTDTLGSHRRTKAIQDQSRKLHRQVGIAVSLVVLSLAATGFLLNHPGLLGAPAERTLSLAANPADPNHLLRGTRSSLYASLDAGLTWDEVPMLFPAEKVVDITYATAPEDVVYVVLQDDGLIRSYDGGFVWERVPIGFVPVVEGIRLDRIAVSSGEGLSLWTSNGLFQSADKGTSWRKVGDSAVEGFDWYAFVHQLHTGYYFGPWFVYVHDFGAWGMMGLVISGLVIWRKRNGKSRRDS